MAVYYDKNGTDMTAILDPREPHGRKVGFADIEWNEARMGGFISMVNAADDNGAYALEEVVVSSVYDYLMIGLKNSDYKNTVIGQTNCAFWGLTGQSTKDTALVDFSFGNRREGTITMDYAVGNYSRFAVSNDSTINAATVGGATASDADALIRIGLLADVVAATNYAMFFGLRFVISNRGTAAQTVEMWLSNGNNTKYTDTSDANLRSLLTNFTSHQYATSSGSLAANDGVDPFPIPDAVFFLTPFLSNRLRIHEKGALFIS